MRTDTQSPHAPLRAPVDKALTLNWVGDVTWRRTASLREALFDGLERAGATGVCLDVRGVNSIDRIGIALLIGANHRATSIGSRLTLVDAHGAITEALCHMRLSEMFLIRQLGA